MRERRAARHQPPCRPRHGAHGHGWHATPVRGACGRRAPDGRDLGPGRRRRRTRQPAPSPVTAAWPAPSLTTFRLTRVHSGDEGGLAARDGTVHARKATVRMTSLDRQRSTRQTPGRLPGRQPGPPEPPTHLPPRPGRSPWSAAKCTAGGTGLMTVSSHPHTRGQAQAQASAPGRPGTSSGAVRGRSPDRPRP